MDIVSEDMRKYLPSDILDKIRMDRIKDIKDGSTVYGRWMKSKLPKPPKQKDNTEGWVR